MPALLDVENNFDADRPPNIKCSRNGSVNFAHSHRAQSDHTVARSIG